MNYRLLIKSLAFFAGLFPMISYCQSTKPDTLILLNSIAKAKEFYTKSIGAEAHLFNGVAHKEFITHKNDVGHPYFFSNDWIKGSIRYEGDAYNNISIQYDLIHDKVIIEHPYSFFKLELIDEKINAFTIQGHTFVKLASDTSKNPQIKAGIFDLLYNGNMKVYAKRRKDKQEVMDAGSIKYVISEKNQYFIYKGGIYYPVKNKSSVLKVLRDRKAVVKKQLSKNKIHFKANRELALYQSAKFYEESEKQL